MPTAKIQTGLRLEQKLLKKMTYIAKKQRRSLNAQIEFAVQELIDAYEKQYGVIEILDDEAEK